ENLSLKSFVILMKASKTIEEQIKEDIRSYGMRISDFTVLEALYHKGNLTVREITESVLINTGSITYVIDKLVKKELVERRHSKEDRRVVHIEITEEGKILMDEVFPAHQKLIEHIFTTISNNEKETLIHILKKVGMTTNNNEENV
ncbi:MAG TPA: MarR family transcriptional regulator, partial [Virgibacillus sp.]|nr:MarR family transcriptional regulator [Virgibacillus sp.]